MNLPALKFTHEQSLAASKAWKASCGPHSIAAATGKTLDEIRRHLPQPYKGWMNPTQISTTLANLGVFPEFRKYASFNMMDLCQGINRLQFEGPWLDKGMDPREAYKHTHYVAQWSGVVLCTACASEWIPINSWFPAIIDSIGEFHITHHWRLP